MIEVYHCSTTTTLYKSKKSPYLPYMKEPLKQYKPKEPAPGLFREKLELPKIKKELPKVFKRISCPACTEGLNAEHIDLPSNVAKCGSCHVLFSIEEELESLKVKQEIKQEIFRPECIARLLNLL